VICLFGVAKLTSDPAFVNFVTQKGRYVCDEYHYIRGKDVSFVTDVNFDNNC
jgi:hypothetical protein